MLAPWPVGCLKKYRTLVPASTANILFFLGGEESYKVRRNARLTATRHEQAGQNRPASGNVLKKQLSRNSATTRNKEKELGTPDGRQATPQLGTQTNN